MFQAKGTAYATAQSEMLDRWGAQGSLTWPPNGYSAFYAECFCVRAESTSVLRVCLCTPGLYARVLQFTVSFAFRPNCFLVYFDVSVWGSPCL